MLSKVRHQVPKHQPPQMPRASAKTHQQSADVMGRNGRVTTVASGIPQGEGLQAPAPALLPGYTEPRLLAWPWLPGPYSRQGRLLGLGGSHPLQDWGFRPGWALHCPESLRNLDRVLVCANLLPRLSQLTAGPILDFTL